MAQTRGSSTDGEILGLRGCRALGPGQRMDAEEPGRTQDPQASTTHGAQQCLESLRLSDTYVLLK